MELLSFPSYEPLPFCLSVKGTEPHSTYLKDLGMQPAVTEELGPHAYLVFCGITLMALFPRNALIGSFSFTTTFILKSWHTGCRACCYDMPQEKAPNKPRYHSIPFPDQPAGPMHCSILASKYKCFGSCPSHLSRSLSSEAVSPEQVNQDVHTKDVISASLPSSLEGFCLSTVYFYFYPTTDGLYIALICPVSPIGFKL